jgi:hypothetical protein
MKKEFFSEDVICVCVCVKGRVVDSFYVGWGNGREISWREVRYADAIGRRGCQTTERGIKELTD